MGGVLQTENPMKKTTPGLILSGAWLCLLVVAYINYPKPDNLAVGWIVFCLRGGDALEALSWAKVIGIAACQLVVVYFLGWSLAAIFIWIRNKIGNRTEGEKRTEPSHDTDA